MEELVSELGLDILPGTTLVKPSGIPSMKVSIAQVNTDKLLPNEKISHFRSLVARANYLAADRPDIQLAAKEVCRWMQVPTELAVAALKKFARYLLGRLRLVYEYKCQEACTLDAFSDTDWAGCVRTRNPRAADV